MIFHVHRPSLSINSSTRQKKILCNSETGHLSSNVAVGQTFFPQDCSSSCNYEKQVQKSFRISFDSQLTIFINITPISGSITITRQKHAPQWDGLVFTPTIITCFGPWCPSETLRLRRNPGY